MKITTSIQRKTYVSSKVKQPKEKIKSSGDAVIQQKKIEPKEIHVGSIADIVKTICDLGILTGGNEKLAIDLKEVKNVSLFVNHLSTAEITANEKFPGTLAKAETIWSARDALSQTKSNLDNIKLSIEEYIIPGVATPALGVIPGVTLNFIDFGKKGIDFLQAEASTPAATYVRQGLEAPNALFNAWSTLEKAGGGESAILGHAIQYSDFAIQGLRAKETFDDLNASGYSKVLSCLKACAAGVEALAGTFSGWEKVKQVAGVSMIVLTLVDKVVTLTLVDDANVLQ